VSDTSELLSKLSFCLLLILPTISVAEVSSVKPFSAVCTDVHVAAYRYELDLEGKVTSDEWSEGEKFGSKWKIIYTGDDSVVVDDEKLPVVALNGPSIIFASPGNALFGAGIWVYAVNLKLKKIVAAQVNSHDGLGTGIKTRSVEFKCDFL